MEIIQGKGVSGGMVCGKICLLRRDKKREHIPRKHSVDPAAERMRFQDGCRTLRQELEELYRKTGEAVGESEAEIFSIHQMMLGDEEFTDAVEERIRQGKDAAEAVLETGEELAKMFSQMDNAYMQARDADIRSIAARLAEILEGVGNSMPDLQESVILAAEDLTPAQTMELDHKMVLGFITEQGSSNSHTAILARMLGIPAVAAAGTLPDSINGKEGILDGGSGVLYVEPDSSVGELYRQTLESEQQTRELWESFRGRTCRTQEGKPVHIYANAGSMEDAEAAAAGDAEGIGLFRSEFLFMQYGRCPTEEEQYTVYRDVLAGMPGKEVIIRTLDAGADKQIPWLPSAAGEANPALGLRAVRLCLRHPELLVTQLRALYRAAAHGKIRAMIPMITLPSELEQVMIIAAGVREALNREQIPHDPDMPIGIMIETPSAALYAGTLAQTAAFFSIGTNDLMQYTMAADRENAALAYLTESLPESLKRLIAMTGEAAAEAGIPVSVCGELAGEEAAIPFLLEAGVTKLSVSPGHVLRVRAAVQKYLDEKKDQ